MVKTQTKILIVLFAVLFVGFLVLSLYSVYTSVSASASTTDGLGTWRFKGLPVQDIISTSSTVTFYCRFLSYDIKNPSNYSSFQYLRFTFDVQSTGTLLDIFTSSPYTPSNSIYLVDTYEVLPDVFPVGSLIYITDVTRGPIPSFFYDLFEFISDDVEPIPNSVDVSLTRFSFNDVVDFTKIGIPSFSFSVPFSLTFTTYAPDTSLSYLGSFSVPCVQLSYLPYEGSSDFGQPALICHYALSSSTELNGYGIYYRWGVSPLPPVSAVPVRYSNCSISFGTDSFIPRNVYSFLLQVSVKSALSTDYNEGYDAGYAAGEQSGSSSGYDSGYVDGKTAGKVEANQTVTKMSASYTAGYSAGINAAGNYTFSSLLGAVFDAPLNAFQEFFNFEVFGVNLTGLLSSLFIIAVVVTILRFVLGG